MALPKVGVQVSAEGAASAARQLAAFDRALEASRKAALKASEAQKKLSLDAKTSATALAQAASRVATAERSVASATQRLEKFRMSTTEGAGAVNGLGGALGGMLGPLGAVAAGGLGLTAVFSKLVSGTKDFVNAFVAAGKLSVTVDNVSRAFGNVVSSFGDSNKVLATLREQVQGTVSDLELMRLTVSSLQGTDPVFRQIVGSDFGNILKNVSQISAALGRDAQLDQQRFVDALKKRERELLDELGIIVDAVTANKAYAAEIGKSATALTDLEKRAAFAKEAIRQLNISAAETGGIAQTGASLQRISAVIQNIRNMQAVSIAPLFNALVGIIDRLAQGFQKVAQFLAPIIRELNVIVGSVITIFFKALSDQVQILYGDLFRLAGEALPYVIATIRLVGRVVIQIAEIFARAFNNIGKIIRKLFPDLAKTTNSGMADLAYRFAYGGGRIIGAFARGILEGAHLVITAVTFIAQIVANFLEGFSPPKEGPLKDIDKGATRVMEAWVDGLVNVDLAPLDVVLQAVNDRLGSIGAFSREQVTARLAELDLAIRPFVEQLDIVKADFEAIAGFADPALKAIDRQRSRLLTLAGEGSLIDINRLRGLDKQAEMLGKMRDTAQDSVDNAEIQLALSKAQQAQERALLNIQMRRLGEADKAGGGATDKPPTGAGGPGNDALAGEISDLVGGAPVDLASVEGIDEAMALIEGAFKAGLADSGAAAALAKVQSQLSTLKAQTDRIQKADPVAKLTKKFAGLTAAISKPFGEAQKIAETAITAIEGAMTGLGAVIDVLAMKFNLQLPTSFNIFKAGADVNLTATLTALNTLVTATILPMLTLLGNKLGINLPISFGLFKTNITINVIDKVIELLGWVEGYVFPAFDTLKTWFSTTLPFAFDDFLASLTINVSTPLLDLEKTISDKVEQAFRRLVQFLNETLRPTIRTISDTVLMPLITLFDGIARKVDDVTNSITDMVNEIKSIPASAGGAAGGLVGDILSGLPFNAKGALGQKGAFIAGERGPELIIPSNGNRYDIFPNAATMALQKMAANPSAMMAQPSNRYAYGGGGATSQSIDNSRSTQMGGVNINVSSPQEALWMQQQMLAKWGS